MAKWVIPETKETKEDPIKYLSHAIYLLVKLENQCHAAAPWGFDPTGFYVGKARESLEKMLEEKL